MKKYKLEIILFIVDAIYMIIELIASRLLSPYFGNSNLVWTSIIGIILLSNSIGNFIGGKIADNDCSKKNLKLILKLSGIFVLIIPFIQEYILLGTSRMIPSIKLGAIISAILLFFVPSMFFGFFSPIIIKLRMNNLENAGKTSGRIYALATIGSLTGTFLGGFLLLPSFGSNELLFILAAILFLLVLLVGEIDIKKDLLFTIVSITLCGGFFYIFNRSNKIQGTAVISGSYNAKVSYDTQYGKVSIFNTENGEDSYRTLLVDKGHESATFIKEDKCNDLVYEYTKYYDLMFESSKDIKNTLMIGGAGYSYPKYYISNYLDKSMDVVEIDEDITDLAKKYFYLDKLIDDYDLNNNKRLGLIADDGRTYLNKNTKKYDAILNDAFSGETPAVTLTTIEAVQKIYNSLTKNGLYLSNVISSIEGENSKFLKAEVNTLKQVFKNVYIIPCNSYNDLYRIQNNMVVATDNILTLENTANLNIPADTIVLTDNYCPIDSLLPNI
jgi:spermidine synthase